MKAEQLLSKDYVINHYELWFDNMGEYPTTDELTRSLWWCEEETNEYEIEDEKTYFDICYDFVKKVLAEQN